MEDSTPAKTPMATTTKLDQDESGKKVDITHYRGMIGSLLYLTASCPDIMFAICLCVRFQADPKESHLIAVKRIFRYLKGTLNLGIWYPKDTGFDLIGYTDSDYASCKIDQKSTSGSSDQITYIFIKPLDEATFSKLVSELGMLNLST
ncbi:putative mitochondrial protein AtMg00240 [Apium graveolens]|uniref:putative mitochondrial protein AtMg00240 n=1 Tax=Apium graveolens TaxID=4045 RepID=UPI003D7B358D